MAIIDPQTQTSKTLYHLMVQSILPRPIAWVLTRNKNETFNLAPFSFFNGICSDPPILMISVGHKEPHVKKDTWTNIENSGDFVVHIPSVVDRADVAASAEVLDYGESEIDRLNLETVTESGWPLPRLKLCKAAFLCGRHQIIEVGNKPQGLILGEIKSVWLEDAAHKWDGERLVIDESIIDPLARLGKNQYASINTLP